MVAPPHNRCNTVNRLYKEYLESNLPLFKGRPHDNSCLWQLRWEVAWGGKELIHMLSVKNVDQRTTEKAMSKAIAALGTGLSVRYKSVENVTRYGLNCKIDMREGCR